MFRWLTNVVQRALGNWGGTDAEYLSGDLFGPTYRAQSGEVVSLFRAIGYPAFRQGLTLLSGDVAKLPFAPYKVNVDGSTELDRSHPAYRLTAWFPNDQQPAFYFWRHMMVHAIIFTHSYAWIRRRNGQPIELIPLLSDRTALLPSGNYVTEIDGEIHGLFKSEVYHLQNMCYGDGDDCELLQQCRDTIGLGLAASNFASRFFKHGGRMGGVLEVPLGMKKQAADRLEEGWRKTYEDKDAQFKTVVLKDNAKFHSAQFDPEKGQLALGRQEQVKETARILNIPAHKLGHDGKTAYNSLEMEERSYVNSSLSHWFKAMAGEANLKLLNEQERDELSHEFGHDVSELISSDSETRSKVGRTEVEIGAISPNEYRRRMKLPPRPGGDVYLTPLNMTGTPAGDDVGSDTDENIEQLLSESISRASRDLAQRVLREARRKKPDKFLVWFDQRFDEYRVDWLAECETTLSLAARLRRSSIDELRTRYTAERFDPLQASIARALETSPAENLADNITQVVETWKGQAA